MKRLIVYDLDGTLVDTLEDLVIAVNHMLKAFQAAEVSAHEVRRSVGRGVRELISSCLKTTDPKRLDDGVHVFRAYYARHLLDHSRLYPDAQAVLDHFKQRRQAVLTNKPTDFAREILERLGVAGYFLEIIGGDSPFPKKPDPTAILELMAREQIGPGDTLLIGDSPIDVETARKAGVMTVCVAHGLSDEAELAVAKPDALVRDFQELLELARRDDW